MPESLGEQERDEAARKYFPLTIWLAKQFWARLPRGVVELDDLIGEASVGLMACLHRYDPSRGTPLPCWVSRNVRWALISSLRKLDRLSQAMRETVKFLQETEADLEQELQRKPTSAEIAENLGCSAEAVEQIMQTANIRMVSIDAEGAAPLPDRQDPSERLEQAERVRALQDCFATLTQEEQVAVRMRLEGARFKDIAVALRTSIAAAHRRLKEGVRKTAECIKDRGWEL